MTFQAPLPLRQTPPLSGVDRCTVALVCSLILFLGVILPPSSAPSPSGHALFADSLSQRHLHLDLSPSEFAASNPASRLQNIVCFNERCYFTLGPGPAALVFLPWRNTSADRINQNALCAILAIIGYLFSVALLAGLFQGSLSTLRIPLRCIGLACLGLGNLNPWLVSSGSDSAIALLWSQAWISAAAYFYFIAFRGGLAVRHGTIMASLCVGLSTTGHPTALPLVLVAACMPLFKSPVLFWRRSDRLLCFLLPCLVFALLVGLINARRFGYWYEFGGTLSPSGQSQLTSELFHPRALLESITVETLRASLNPVEWISSVICSRSSKVSACQELNVGILVALPGTALLLLIPLLLILRRLLMAHSLDPDPAPAAAPTAFVTATVLIQLGVVTSGVAGLVDSAQLPAGLDWAVSNLSVIYGVMGHLILTRESGWSSGWSMVSSIIVPVCLTLSILMGLALSPFL